MKICATNIYSDTTQADYETILATLSNGVDAKGLVIASGDTFSQPLAKVALAHPNIHYWIIDAVVDLDNVTSAVFSEHEGVLLAGVTAGLTAKASNQDTLDFRMWHGR